MKVNLLKILKAPFIRYLCIFIPVFSMVPNPTNPLVGKSWCRFYGTLHVQIISLNQNKSFKSQRPIRKKKIIYQWKSSSTPHPSIGNLYNRLKYVHSYPVIVSLFLSFILFLSKPDYISEERKTHDGCTLPVASLELGGRVFDKAELLQLNHTQIICMIILLLKS